MTNKKHLTTILLLITVLLFTCLVPTLADNNLKAHFIDVGQGDAILVELPNNETMLIDAGDNTAETLVVNYLNSQGINKIDYLIGTHPHADHIGGLDNVIANFTIGEIYLPNVNHTTQTYKDLLLAIKRKNKKITAGKAGLSLITAKDLTVTLIGPVKTNYDQLNNHSIVTKVEYKNTSFLFPGDIEAEAEFDLLLSSRFKPTADVLKVAHHGSESSTSTNFLNLVNPKQAVISVGTNNRYNHPAPEIISRLNKQGIKTYRTDKQGTIIATSNGEEITFNTKAVANHQDKVQTNTATNKVVISYLNCAAELVKIKNNSKQDINISGWKLVSVQGNQTFYFPAGTILKAGATIKITAGPDATSGKNKFIWDDWYIWNNNGDSAKLYNSNGELVAHHQ